MRNLKFFAGFAVVVVVVLAVAIVYVMHTERPRPVPGRAPAGERKHPSFKRETVPPMPGKHETAGEPSSKTRQVAIIIDDIGNDIAPVEELLALDAPITFAILPHCAHSVDAALMLHRAGREILLHLPMEPHDYPGQKPGAGALFLRMNDDEIRRQVKDDLASVPYISGINNHMGSRFMEDEAKLSIVLKQIKERGLFFVDSRTTQHSMAEKLAAQLGLEFASRKIFIDNSRTYRDTFQNLTGAGGKNSSVVMIGHPYPSTIHALKEALPILKAQGVRIVSASELALPVHIKRP